MTHLYTVVVDATVLPDPVRAPASAIAWASDTVLALGSDTEVLEISRGDSHVVHLPGAFVVPLDAEGSATWPPPTTLEIGGPADIAFLLDDPRVASNETPRQLAVVRGGAVVSGSLGPAHAHDDG